MKREGRSLWGIVAVYRDPAHLIRAAERVRDEGYTCWDCHTPFPVHGLDGAMGIRPTPLAWYVLGAGLAGVSGGILMQWWMNAVDYRLVISGKPFWSLPANIPVAFEVTVLLASLTAFLGMLVMNGLPRFHHPLFRIPEFRRVTDDAFLLAIEARDPRFDVEQTESLLRDVGGTAIRWVEA